MAEISYPKIFKKLIGYAGVEAISKGLNLLLFLSLASVLSHHEYAGVSILIAAELILTEFLVLGQGAYLMRIYKSCDSKLYEIKLIGSKKIMLSVLFLALFVTLLLPPDQYKKVVNSIDKWSMVSLVMAIGIQAQIFVQQINWRVRDNATNYSIVRVINQILKSTIIYTLAVKIKTANVYAYGLLICNILTLIAIYTVTINRKSSKKEVKSDKTAWLVRDNLKFGIPIAIHGIAGSAYVILDRIFLAKMADAESLATYSFCLNQGTSVFFLIYILSFTLMPKFYESKDYDAESKRYLNMFLISSIGGAILMSLIIFYVVFPISLKFVPATYAAGIAVLPLILFGGILLCVENYFMYKMAALNSVKPLPIITICSLITRFSVNLYMVPQRGVFGVVYANIISQILNCIVMFIVSENIRRNQLKQC
jgi:O-antigen/teichoic acid export membrane protein